MGFNTLWIKTTLAVALTFWLAPPILAAAPTEICATAAQTITLPYTFEPIPLATPQYSFMPDFTDVTFINSVGSYALTIFSMLDALAFMGALVVIYLSIRVLVWLYGFVTEEPTDVEKMDVSGGIDAYATASNLPIEQEASQNDAFASDTRNPLLKKYYKQRAKTQRETMKSNNAWAGFSKKVIKFGKNPYKY